MQYPTIQMPSGRTWGGQETNGPLNFGWALAAFLGGAMFGMMAGKKKAMMASHMRGQGGMGPGMGAGGGGMPMWKHHHHGFGQSACHMKHQMSEPAAPGAQGEKPHERDDGE